MSDNTSCLGVDIPGAAETVNETENAAYRIVDLADRLSDILKRTKNDWDSTGADEFRLRGNACAASLRDAAAAIRERTDKMKKILDVYCETERSSRAHTEDLTGGLIS